MRKYHLALGYIDATLCLIFLFADRFGMALLFGCLASFLLLTADAIGEIEE